eukprot:4289052-Pleurochrysis_carterae.AAC.1
MRDFRRAKRAWCVPVPACPGGGARIASGSCAFRTAGADEARASVRARAARVCTARAARARVRARAARVHAACVHASRMRERARVRVRMCPRLRPASVGRRGGKGRRGKAWWGWQGVAWVAVWRRHRVRARPCPGPPVPCTQRKLAGCTQPANIAS